MKKEFTERDYNRMSLVFTVLMSTSFINYVIGQVFNIGGMIISISILGMIMLYFYKTIVKIKIPATALMLMILITVYYLFTRQVSITTVFGRHFMFYFIAASVLGMYRCNTEKFLRFMTYMVLLCLPFYTSIFVEMTSTRYNTGISMGLSYALFPILLASVVHFVFYRKSANFLIYILYVVGAILFANLIFKGTRGIVLSMLVFVALVFIFNSEFDKKRRVDTIKVIVMLITAIVLVVYFYDIVKWLDELFDRWNIEANFIQKILNLSRDGDVTNGRSNIFEYTVEKIIEKPFIGHGIGTMFYNSGYRFVYPHNVFLQLLYDGGLILFIPVVFALALAVRYTFLGEDRDEAIFTLYIITVFFPSAMVSGDIWNNEALWILVMHSLRFYVVRRKKTRAINQRDVVINTRGKLSEG